MNADALSRMDADRRRNVGAAHAPPIWTMLHAAHGTGDFNVDVVGALTEAHVDAVLVQCCRCM